MCDLDHFREPGVPGSDPMSLVDRAILLRMLVPGSMDIPLVVMDDTLRARSQSTDYSLHVARDIWYIVRVIHSE